MEETTTKAIQLVQKPVIKHYLLEIGKSVTERIESLNLEKLLVTDETIQSMKSLRADLNKEFADYEAQRKSLKEAVAAPYIDFEDVYKSEIQTKYKGADEILKDKISAFEIKIKEDREKEIKEYFEELCKSEEIDFVKFEQANIKINLSTSMKKYREQCDEFISKVKDDIKLISSDQYSVEIMAEYKVSLNSSKAITDVRERKERERLEKERQLLEKTAKRESQLRSLTMVSNQIAKVFYFVQDETIIIDQKDIENLSDEDWAKSYAELKFSIESFNESQKKPELEQPEPKTQPTPVQETLKAPTVIEEKKTDKIRVARFIAKGTFQQLKSLAEYMKSNDIKYENIE